MPAADLNVLTPGAPAPADPIDDTPLDPKDQRIMELEGTVAQLNAALEQAQTTIRAMETVPKRHDAVGEPERIIGEDWRSKTTAEAHAAGVKKTVLCKDGYYVPG